MKAQFSAPSLSPATIQNAEASKDIIKRVHDAKVDPNALLLLWRNEEERQAKAKGLPATFLRGRQEALESYAKQAENQQNNGWLRDFYAKKIEENGGLLKALEGKGDAAKQAEMEQTGKALWEGVLETVEYLEDQLSDKSMFLLGDQVSLAEYVAPVSLSLPPHTGSHSMFAHSLHAGAWLARVLACAGATSVSDPEAALSALESNLPGAVPLGPKIQRWTKELFARDSFKEVYGEGLH